MLHAEEGLDARVLELRPQSARTNAQCENRGAGMSARAEQGVRGNNTRLHNGVKIVEKLRCRIRSRHEKTISGARARHVQ